MRRRFDRCDVQLIKLLNVAEHLPQLRPELLFFFGGETKPRKVRDILDVQVRGSHYSSSNFRFTSASNSTTARAASSPSAKISNLLLGPAASIIKPMMLLPLTR